MYSPADSTWVRNCDSDDDDDDNDDQADSVDDRGDHVDARVREAANPPADDRRGDFLANPDRFSDSPPTVRRVDGHEARNRGRRDGTSDHQRSIPTPIDMVHDPRNGFLHLHGRSDRGS